MRLVINDQYKYNGTFCVYPAITRFGPVPWEMAQITARPRHNHGKGQTKRFGCERAKQADMHDEPIQQHKREHGSEPIRKAIVDVSYKRCMDSRESRQ